MKLLVSVVNLHEAEMCIGTEVDIVDIKNPVEGSLGGHSPRLIKKVRPIVPPPIVLSATIGDVPNKPGIVSQAALGLALCDVDYIKLGLCDNFSIRDAVFLAREVVETVREVRPKVKIAICGYADAKLKGLISPGHIPRIVFEAGADIAMMDTLKKGDGRGLFDYQADIEVEAFCTEAKKCGLQTALAGSLTKGDILKIKKMGSCDIVGIRTLVCHGHDRGSSIDKTSVKDVSQLLSI